MKAEMVHSVWWRQVSGFLHQGKTVCCRAERLCVHLSWEEPVDAVSIEYVNRLSDALPVPARWGSQGPRETGIPLAT